MFQLKWLKVDGLSPFSLFFHLLAEHQLLDDLEGHALKLAGAFLFFNPQENEE